MRVVTGLEEERHLTQIKNFPQLSDHRKETSLSKSTSRFNANSSHNGWTAIHGTFGVLHTSLILFSIGEKPFPIDRFHVKFPTKHRYFFISNMLHYSGTCDVIDWSKQHNFRKRHFFESFYCIFSLFDQRYCQYHSISTHLIARVTMNLSKLSTEIDWHWQ